MKRLALLSLLLATPALAQQLPSPQFQDVTVAGAGGYKQYGHTIFTTIPGVASNDAVLAGPYAGVNLQNVGYGMVAMGAFALSMETNGGAEDVAIGLSTFAEVQGQYGNTGIGEHVGGFDPAIAYATMGGFDSGRDAFGLALATTWGAMTLDDGELAGPNTVIGSLSVLGNGPGVEIPAGTFHQGDTYSVTFTTAAPCGSAPCMEIPNPTASFVVPASPTIDAVANGLANAIASMGMCYNSPQPAGAPAACTAIGGDASFDTLGNYYVTLHGPGGSTTGMKITLAPSCSGTCSVAMSTIASFQGQNNVVVGSRVLGGKHISGDVSYNSLFGDSIATTATAGFNSNDISGMEALKNATNDNDSSIHGVLAFHVARGSTNLTGVGYKVGISTGAGASNLTFIGGGVGSYWPRVGGHDVLLLGTSASCDAPADNMNNYIGLCGGGGVAFSVANAGTPSASTATVAGSLTVAGGINTTGASGYSIGGTSAFSVTGNNNVAIDSPPFSALTTGKENIVIMGSGAGPVITSSWNNILIGKQAGQSITDCSLGLGNGYDTAIGIYALMNDNGCENTAVGTNTLTHNTSGTFNVAIGNDALLTNTTSGGNIGIGHAAGGGTSSSAPGGQNVSIGDNTAAFLGAGAQFNVFIGALAGQGNNATANTGQQNVYAGWSAGQSNGSGSQNVGVGFATMVGNSGAPLNGSGNTGVGYEAGLNLQGSSTQNTLVGSAAAWQETVGNLLVAVGASAAQNCTGCSNSVIVGAGIASGCVTCALDILVGPGADVPAGDASYYMGLSFAIQETLAPPTVASGFGTGASITGRSSASFAVHVGTGGTAANGTLNLSQAANNNAMVNGWVCQATDVTNPQLYNVKAIPAGQSQITLINYPAAGGASAAWTAGDTVAVFCNGY